MVFPWTKTRPTGKTDIRIYGYDEETSTASTASGWFIYGFLDDNGATSFGYRITITDTSCLTFGGGIRSSAIYTPIFLNTYNTSLHLADNVGLGNNDVCPSPHLNIVTRAKGTSNGCYVNNGSLITISDSTPLSGRGLMIHYYDNDDIQITNCDIFSGSGTNAHDLPQKCKFGIFELGTTKASNQWYDVFYGSALGLSQKVAAKNHFWYVAISLMPTAIGFCTSNSIKIEAIYQ